MNLSSLQDTVFVCAVATILVIRLQLWATNYPQLGGGKLHIAHLLWGGLGMLVAICLVLSYLGPKVLRAGAILGGIGFGFFIDELGKFITSDNDYFYKPAAGVIYLVFVGLFFAMRWLRRRRELTQKESLVNAAEILTEAALHDLDTREQRLALELIGRADQSDPLVAPLRALLVELHSLPVRPPGRLTRAARWIRAHYFRLIDESWFPRALRIFFVVIGLLSVVQVFGAVFDVYVVAENGHLSVTVNELDNPAAHLGFFGWANVISSALAAVLLWIGIVRFGRSRLQGYRWIERSLLVSILLTQVFVFIQSQFAGVFGLSIELVLLVTVRSMMRAELKLAEVKRAAPPVEQAPEVPPPVRDEALGVGR